MNILKSLAEIDSTTAIIIQGILDVKNNMENTASESKVIIDKPQVLVNLADDTKNTKIANEMLRISKNLSNISNNLKQEINNFKV